MSRTDAADGRFMDAALGLARRGLGRVWPNPAVGCVLCRDGRVVGRGWTQPGGRPHGETEAIRRAGGATRGATAYVSLEPCAHTGKTPPCAEALVDAGIARAVIAVEDPDPRVAGAGVRRLREAGVAVEVGLRGEAARALNAGFFCRVLEGRPLVTLKTATSLDGRIATESGESQWITGEIARTWGHGMRARHDAVMVGAGTALADDPRLTCRLPGLADRNPVRVVMDATLRLPPTCALAADADAIPTWVFAAPGADAGRRRALEKTGIEVIEAAADDEGRPALLGALNALAGRGITRLLVEGGGRLAGEFLAAGVVDRIAWFRAPGVIGGDGVPAVAPFGVARLAEVAAFARSDTQAAGPDLLETYVRQA